MIDRNYRRSEQLLRDNLDKLHDMADALIKYETIDSDQIDDIMAGRPPREPADSSTDAEPPSTGSSINLDKDRRSKKPIGGPAQQH